MTNSPLVLPEIEKSGKMTIQEYAYVRLRHALMVGSIAPGVPVTIRGLASAMEISPTPVREALRRLSSQNALCVLENRRIVVPSMTAKRFHELVSLRCAIEIHAAERALPFISDNIIDRLVVIDTIMDEAVTAQDSITLIIQNQLFHGHIYRSNRDQLSMPMIESIWLQLGPFMRIALRHVGSFYGVDRHKEIIAALHDRNLGDLLQAIQADIHDGVGWLDNDAMEKILGPGKSETTDEHLAL